MSTNEQKKFREIESHLESVASTPQSKIDPDWLMQAILWLCGRVRGLTMEREALRSTLVAATVHAHLAEQKFLMKGDPRPQLAKLVAVLDAYSPPKG